MDRDVKKEAQVCEVCQQYKKAPAAAPLHPWEWPATPWSRIHVDYAGLFQGKMFLIFSGLTFEVDGGVPNNYSHLSNHYRKAQACHGCWYQTMFLVLQVLILLNS